MSNKTGKGRVAIKINLWKAFDSIRWPYIKAVLQAMNFDHTWISWIMACIQFPQFSVLINGSPFGFFGSSSGLRQGDPISPLLFVLSMEILSQLLDNVLRDKTIEPYTKKSISVSHLLFADDLIIFSASLAKSGSDLREILNRGSVTCEVFGATIVHREPLSPNVLAIGRQTPKTTATLAWTFSFHGWSP
ncbi:hypothetical protein QJS10_CPB22g00323 [Acorus calamus]|uniref:Reverse transcriptase domain-containing protein n=1 Tax=Acorus calamus TaxID=4465 RepID=A0AAV9BZW2_ACOCL|nr:hypothetical protein QJS10_CPB22g00323 [Acorus calamus]